jgi:hypothetical protein
VRGYACGGSDHIVKLLCRRSDTSTEPTLLSKPDTRLSLPRCSAARQANLWRFGGDIPRWTGRTPWRPSTPATLAGMRHRRCAGNQEEKNQAPRNDKRQRRLIGNTRELLC